MTRKCTIKVRMRKELHDILRTRFPEVRMPDLLQMTYDTSLLKLESGLRKKTKKR